MSGVSNSGWVFPGGAFAAALTYLNRLSDHLFVMTRLVNANADGDVLWVPGGSR